MAKILCIDDEDYIRDDISEFISSLGHETLTAHDGKSGLEAIVAHNPDLVLSDFTMPNMDGGELLTKLRDAHPDCADIPFIFLSALADREDVMQGLKLGADDYLTKPIDFDMLEIKVSAALRQMNRMQEKKEQDFIKLFNELSGEQGSENIVDIIQPSQEPVLEVTSSSKNEVLNLDVHGCVVRFHSLETTENETIGKQRARLIDYFCQMAAEYLAKFSSKKITVNHISNAGLLICFFEADFDEAAKKSSLVLEKLESYFHDTALDTLIKTLNIPSVVLRDLLDLSICPYVFATSENLVKTKEDFDAAIIEEIKKSSSGDNLKESLSAYLEDNFGHLTILNLVREDHQPVPISFFSLSEKLENGLKARLALLDIEKQKLAKFYLDILYLEKLNSDVKNYPKTKTVVLDVHYETISERERLVSYLGHYEKIANILSLKHKIILNIIDFPSDRPNWYMEKLLTPFGNHISRAIVQVSHDKLADFAASNNGITAAVCDYKEFARQDIEPAIIMEAKEKLVKTGKLCILRGLPSDKPLEELKDFGFNGHAIRTF